MVREMGKTLKSAIAEAQKCASACRYYAERAEQFLADERAESSAALSYIRYLPLGPVLAVMPWNFPFWQVFRFAAPAIMAGNVGVLKHASNVPQCALAIEDLFRRAGFKPGVFQTLLIGSKRVKAIIEDPRIVAVTLTGSDAAGADVAQAAGKNLKKTVLELGGSDPFIVMPSANLEQAIATATTARNINNGQSCIAAKRFIIHEDVYARFCDGFVEAFRRLKIGDPMLEDTDVGPLATRDVFENLDHQVQRSVAAGAKVLIGGRRIDGKGYFYYPTILADIPPAAPVRREEVFGPVAAVYRVHNIQEAIAMANDSPYGLGSSAWTNDEKEQRQFIDEIEAGQTFINAMVASDPRLPFGGIKRSGYGRELSKLGIREFVNIKTAYINRAAESERSRSE
jgi:succinate-semialdehyde dehydrogenase/glutarate-semialdehyde dehydrogenase